jgi:ribosomal protein S14
MSRNRTNSPPASPYDNLALAGHAAAIHHLGRQAVKNVIEIGRRLTECKEIVRKLGGSWGDWLEHEFNWSDQQARRFIHVFEHKSELNKLLNSDFPVSALYLLAAPSTPKEARTEVIERAQAGETVPVAEVKRTIERTKGRVQPSHRTTGAPTKPESSASPTAHFEVGAELKDLIATKTPGWTGATVGTQAEVDAAIERLRNDGAPEHWLIVAPREPVVVNHRVIQWVLLTAPAPPVRAHIVWAFSLCDAANKARCPIWVSERLTGKSHPQQAGMTWPRELPIPQQVPGDDIGADSRTEAERLRARIEELQAQVRQRDIKITGLESEIEEAKTTAKPAPESKSASRCSICHEKKRAVLRPVFICDNCIDIHEIREAAPPADDGLDIPECLRRSPAS